MLFCCLSRAPHCCLSFLHLCPILHLSLNYSALISGVLSPLRTFRFSISHQFFSISHFWCPSLFDFSQSVFPAPHLSVSLSDKFYHFVYLCFSMFLHPALLHCLYWAVLLSTPLSFSSAIVFSVPVLAFLSLPPCHSPSLSCFLAFSVLVTITILSFSIPLS